MAAERRVALNVDVAEGDAEELERLTRQLRGELEELEVEGVEPIAERRAPEGTKAADLIAVGALLVRFGPAAASAVARTIAAWVRRDAHRSVTIQCGDRKLELTAATTEQQNRLVEEFLTADDC